MLTDVLAQQWLTPQESKVYLALLQVWTAPCSTVARILQKNRVTIHSIMKNLHKKGFVKAHMHQHHTLYSCIHPEELLHSSEQKTEHLKRHLPELLAMANTIDSKVQTQLYEGLEWLKVVYQNIINGSKDMQKNEPFLTFVGTSTMDPALHSYLMNEFVPRRLQCPTKTKAIIANINSDYAAYNHDHHESIIIHDPLFEFANEIVLFGKAKVAILMYETKELSWLIITSPTLHGCLKSMFEYIWKLHHRHVTK